MKTENQKLYQKHQKQNQKTNHHNKQLGKRGIFGSPHVFLGITLILIIFSTYYVVGYYKESTEYYSMRKDYIAFQSEGGDILSAMKLQKSFKNVSVDVIEGYHPTNEYFCGIYKHQEVRIEIYENDNCYKPLQSLYHEYGHYIFYQIITEKEKDEYCEIFEKADYYPSFYAIEGGCYEDFADSYAIYKMNPKLLDSDRRGYFTILYNKYLGVI